MYTRRSRFHLFWCNLGIHRWKRHSGRARYCKRCGVWQRLDFYSNHTQRWVTVEEEE